ncbi:hypothetical protein [Bacillus xiapuensis]|uniref:Phage protein n=1 Tax=Bacillus xiapuensis TaxID=2014075 RepID=A0ABU6N7Y2_9BACI|nr:hypothetical protein [Bacillus xiapuensis]
MNLQWTFTNNNDWVHEAFLTKEEAIKEGKLTLEGSFFIGQLIATDEEHVYMIENIEEID